MSVQFGNWDFGPEANTTLDLGPIRNSLAPYGADGEGRFHDENVDILFHRLFETEDTGIEEQPYRIGPTQVLTWDGRLDNRAELLRELAPTVRASATDVAIVAAAYKRWGLGCLPKLVGDWALSIWDSAEQQLVLAKDFLGTRSLFYSVERTRVRWCTVLDPLVLFAGRQFRLNREYLAGWFGLFPASHLTPYIGVNSVPPASFVVVRKDSLRIKEFWRFAAEKILVYRKDSDYEEAFRALLEQSVRRRLRSHFPVLAELSGGMDSSSIVSMADRILATPGAPAVRLDTITYHSSLEPNWNELPYVQKVEAQRGRTGYRIEVNSDEAFDFDSDPSKFMAAPGSLPLPGKSGREFSQILLDSRSRVLLSGIGGDEVLGGAPCPAPLLGDLLVRGRLRTLGDQVVAWALVLRKPLYSILCETLALFRLGPSASRSVSPPGWLCPVFLHAHSRAVRGYPRRTHLFGPRPSFQASLDTIDALRRQQSCFPLSAEPPHHKRYPYLDRDLLEFLFAIPQDQLLRPHQRRSLMRRALAGIVPRELLDRKRKAFVIRGPLLAISSQCAKLEAIVPEMMGCSLDIIDPDALVAALREARAGGPVAVTPLFRVFAIERWLQNVARWKVFPELELGPGPRVTANCRTVRPSELGTQRLS